jgi:hypothetical protein
MAKFDSVICHAIAFERRIQEDVSRESIDPYSLRWICAWVSCTALLLWCAFRVDHQSSSALLNPGTPMAKLAPQNPTTTMGVRSAPTHV